jgi:hypothetical protein
MTEEEPIAAEAAQPAATPPAAEPPRAAPSVAAPGRRVLGIVVAVGFVVGAAAWGWLWQQQQDLAARIQPAPAPSIDPARLAGLESRLASLQQRVAPLEQRPAAPAVDLQPLAARVDAVAARVDALQGPDAGTVQSLNGRLQGVEQRLGEVERHEQAASARAERVARMRAAGAALAAGQPLGDIPGAPAALNRFASASPPTEASLRLAFPAAAAAAEQASQPNAGASLPDRIWQRVETLLIVRQGDKVLVGPPAAQVLPQAQARLDAGDLAGAVAALDQLDPGAAKAMAGWRAQAQSLLDAQAALASMERS